MKPQLHKSVIGKKKRGSRVALENRATRSNKPPTGRARTSLTNEPVGQAHMLTTTRLARASENPRDDLPFLSMCDFACVRAYVPEGM